MRSHIHDAVAAIWRDLSNRRGIGHELNDCDDDIRDEIEATIGLAVAKACDEQERETRHKALTEAAELARLRIACGANEHGYHIAREITAAIERLRDGGLR